MIIIVIVVVVFGAGVGGTVYYYERVKNGGPNTPNAAARPGVENAVYDHPAKTDGFGFASSAVAEDAGGYLEVDGTQTKR